MDISKVKRQNEKEAEEFIISGKDFVMQRVSSPPHKVVRLNFPQTLVYHSPTGMDWGYAGSGPSETALNILFLCTGNQELSMLHHQAFKWKFITGIPEEGGTIKRADVIAWLDKEMAGEGA